MAYPPHQMSQGYPPQNGHSYPQPAPYMYAGGAGTSQQHASGYAAPQAGYGPQHQAQGGYPHPQGYSQTPVQSGYVAHHHPPTQGGYAPPAQPSYLPQQQHGFPAQASPQQFQHTPQPTSIPQSLGTQTIIPPNVPHPYTATGKNQKTLFIPSRSAALFTVVHDGKTSIHRGPSPSSPAVGSASFSSGKVDLHFNSQTYSFRQTFSSQTNLGSSLTWSVQPLRSAADNSLVGYSWILADDATRREVARFTVTANIYKKMVEGQLQVTKENGMSVEQFEEVFVTLVAEMERDRKKQGRDSWMLETWSWVNPMSWMN
ncbi:hypothetical protein QBC43DRAFT_298079 [Cladorrhinum sp. PSN259]|nr:hypothetical protein QBC43DRAFT_298079 [Cladorrhinum sp. PSN259]